MDNLYEILPLKSSRFNDYGSLEMPENHLHKGVGRAAGQMNTPYGAGESMTVSSLGQSLQWPCFRLLRWMDGYFKTQIRNRKIPSHDWRRWAIRSGWRGTG